jgi:hypothetical protein
MIINKDFKEFLEILNITFIVKLMLMYGGKNK